MKMPERRMYIYCLIIFNWWTKEKEREIEETIKNDDEHEKVSLEDHEDLVKNLKYDNNQKAEKLKEILTTPKQIIVSKK